MKEKENKTEEKPPVAVFDSEAFRQQKFTPREGTVDVTGTVLAKYFTGLKEGEKAIWTLRGLTADEIYKSTPSSAQEKYAISLVEALESSDQREISETIKNIMGVGDDVHREVATRVSQLAIASMSPTIPRPVAVKIANIAPSLFLTMSGKVLELTDMGQIEGKSQPSGTGKT